jgi:hypothetical protein
VGTNMSERFTEILRGASEPAWSDALGHRFVKELFAGAVPDAVMARYLTGCYAPAVPAGDVSRRSAQAYGT